MAFSFIQIHKESRFFGVKVCRGPRKLPMWHAMGSGFEVEGGLDLDLDPV